MKSRLAPLPYPRLARLVLLYTRDDDFKTVVRQALWDTGTVLLIAGTVEEALQMFADESVSWMSLSWLSMEIAVG